MWPERAEDAAGERFGSEVVVRADRLPVQASRVPHINNLNVTEHSTVHVGPKIVTVNQSVHNTEVVKDLSCTAYIGSLVQHSSRAERVACALAVIALLLCTFLIVYFTVFAKGGNTQEDRAPWNVTREMWLAQQYNASDSILKVYKPLKLVIIQHSASTECHTFALCAAEIRNLQSYYIRDKQRDIPYNFLVGNDGRVYEGRGWDIEGAHTLGFNRCSLGIGFIGDYREEIEVYTKVTEAQIAHTMLLLEDGVKRGYLRRDYLIVGAKDLKSTVSPGSNLHKAMQTWSHYDHQHRYKNKTCDQINDMP